MKALQNNARFNKSLVFVPDVKCHTWGDETQYSYHNKQTTTPYTSRKTGFSGIPLHLNTRVKIKIKKICAARSNALSSYKLEISKIGYDTLNKVGLYA